jgi:hypothetical protein
MGTPTNKPDAELLRVMTRGMHHQFCKCGEWPCQYRLRFDPTEYARAALLAMLAAGYDWVKRPEMRVSDRVGECTDG